MEYHNATTVESVAETLKGEALFSGASKSQLPHTGHCWSGHTARVTAASATALKADYLIKAYERPNPIVNQNDSQDGIFWFLRKILFFQQRGK